MKKLFLILFGVMCIYPDPAFAQVYSPNGYHLAPYDTIRVFLVFAERTNLPSYDEYSYGWEPGEMPDRAGDFFDPEFIDYNSINGYLTKYFYKMSFGKFIVLGDYYPNIVQIDSSLGISDNVILNYLSSLPGNDIITQNGKSFNSSFDYWQTTLHGEPKIATSDTLIDMLLICWRNAYGNNSGSVSCNNSYKIIKGKKGFNSIGRFGNYNGAPDKLIIRHEMVHPFLGSNNYHTGGSGHIGVYRKFLQDVCGHSIISSYNHTLKSCNAWDRRRFDWKFLGSTYSIKALSVYSNQEVNTDLLYGDPFPNNNNEFILRDFVTYGDAVRIKLPYIDLNDTIYSQWLWIENHQGFEEDIDLFRNATPGIYAYIQNQKEDMNNVSEGGTNYTYSLTAIGNYDFVYNNLKSTSEDSELYDYLGEMFPSNLTKATIVGNSDLKNPFTGQHVSMLHAVDLNDDDLIGGDELLNPNITTIEGHTFTSSECHYMQYTIFGTSYDAFTEGRKIGLGTNPSTAPIYTYRSKDITDHSNLNYYTTCYNTDNRKIELNGLSIEVIEQYANGNIKVKVLWNDYDVKQDIRWCGNIILREEVNLTSGNTIHIDQGLSPTKPVNPQIINGVKVFTDPTVFTCKTNSIFSIREDSEVIVDNGSTFVLEYNSDLVLYDGAQFVLRNNSTMILESESNVTLYQDAKILVEEGSRIIFNGSNIDLHDNNSLIEFIGDLEIGSNETFTFSGNGYVKFSNPGADTTTNITAGAGASMLFKGSGKNHKVLEVQQNTVRFPLLDSLVFRDCKIEMGENKRMIADPPYPITFENVKLTSTSGTHNNHRSFWFSGQSNVTINNSIFEYGQYGIYGNLTWTNGAPLYITNSTFHNNTYGIYILNKGLHLYNCIVYDNTSYGVYCSGMSFTSEFNNCFFINNNNGLYYNGSTSSNVNIDDTYFVWHNNDAIKTSGGFNCNLNCSYIFENSRYGVYATNGTKINPFKCDMSNNLKTIYLNYGTVNLNAKYNQLQALNNGFAVSGYSDVRAICGTNIYQSCNNNRWESNPSVAPLYNSNFKLWVYGCPTVPQPTIIYLTDSNPQYQLCGIKMSSEALLTIDSLNLSTFFESNLSLNTESSEMDDFQNEPINYSAIIHNEIESYYQQLNSLEAVSGTVINEKYNYIQELIADYFIKIEYDKNNETFQETANDIINFINALATRKNISELDYYTFHLDIALLNRLLGKYDLSIDQLNTLSLFTEQNLVLSNSEYNYLQKWLCFIEAEQQLEEGVISIDEFDLAIEDCNYYYSQLIDDDLLVSESESMEQNNCLTINVLPNPNQGTFSIVLNQLDRQGEIRITKTGGQLVYLKQYANEALTISGFSKGEYTVYYIENQEIKANANFIVE